MERLAADLSWWTRYTLRATNTKSPGDTADSQYETPIVVRVERLHLEPAARQQVFGLEAEKVTHGESMHQPLLAPVGMGHVVDQLGVLHLAEVVPCQRCGARREARGGRRAC